MTRAVATRVQVMVKYLNVLVTGYSDSQTISLSPKTIVCLMVDILRNETNSTVPKQELSASNVTRSKSELVGPVVRPVTA